MKGMRFYFPPFISSQCVPDCFYDISFQYYIEQLLRGLKFVPFHNMFAIALNFYQPMSQVSMSNDQIESVICVKQ